MRGKPPRQAIAWLLPGALCCCIALSMLLLDPSGGLTGWLTAWLFFSSIPIGGLFLSMMMEVIPGAWRRQLYPSRLNIPVLFAAMLIGLLPLLLGFHVLHDAADIWERNSFKAFYLSEPFVILRALSFLAVSAFVAVRLASQDEKRMKDAPQPARRPVAIIGLLVLTLLHSMIAIDWIESLQPKFHSSGFGLYVLSIQMTVALNVLVILRLADRKDPRRRDRETSTFGPLMLVALLFWAYLAFMQYFITWSENLPDEVAWYLLRGKGPWSIAEYVIGASQLVPLAMLLFPPIRLSHRCLLSLTVLILLGKMLELVWLVFPGVDVDFLPSCLSVLFATAGFGCLAAGIGRIVLELAAGRRAFRSGASS